MEGHELVHVPLGMMFADGSPPPPMAVQPGVEMPMEMWVRSRKLFELIDDDQSGTVEKVT